ncbi:hypothetical protein [Corynebacterium macginleyi]|uniref:Uncharacterized protein n=1 Tax=Corynebacterium macginleyi TaxID=38290 RepID=A0ABS1Y4J3_9CORY|nr:hypothetical protein [Corynebacterium macginleyi]MBK4141354.1 hypothetical protein [Corynebacterium macginleyi]MBK4145057.1 hypothetical protein [Corynebacterium macginleyi]MBK4149154.1 hypothetical protein [Corynebacterium macginleyi]MBK4159561.1 hypothetical protein [Corynebacterium macginleyi]MBK4166536.1 hypothetical protein [Corynebacterium macginleyi]
MVRTLSWIFDYEVKRRQAMSAVEEAQVEMVKDVAAQGEITRPEVATEKAAINGDGIIPAWHSPQGKKHKAYLHQPSGRAELRPAECAGFWVGGLESAERGRAGGGPDRRPGGRITGTECSGVA